MIFCGRVVVSEHHVSGQKTATAGKRGGGLRGLVVDSANAVPHRAMATASVMVVNFIVFSF